jgi:hypothetical protein
MKKIKVSYFKKIDNEWFTSTKYFDKWEDAWEYMSSLTNVRKFEVVINRD